MSENLPTNVQLESTASGTVSFAPEVIATIAGVAAMEVEGVASMYAGTGSNSLAEMFSRKSTSSKSLTKGVRVDFADGNVNVDVAIIVDYGMPIPDITLSIQENVKKAIETMSGLHVTSVDVHVQGLSFERENQKALEEAKQQRIAMEKAVAEAEAELAKEETAAEEPAAEESSEEPACEEEAAACGCEEEADAQAEASGETEADPE